MRSRRSRYPSPAPSRAAASRTSRAIRVTPSETVPVCSTATLCAARRRSSRDAEAGARWCRPGSGCRSPPPRRDRASSAEGTGEVDQHVALLRERRRIAAGIAIPPAIVAPRSSGDAGERLAHPSCAADDADAGHGGAPENAGRPPGARLWCRRPDATSIAVGQGLACRKHQRTRRAATDYRVAQCTKLRHAARAARPSGGVSRRPDSGEDRMSFPCGALLPTPCSSPVPAFAQRDAAVPTPSPTPYAQESALHWPAGPVMDRVAPPLPPPMKRGAVLVLSKTNGFRDSEQIVHRPRGC